MKNIIVILAVLFAGQAAACEHDKVRHKEHKHPCAEEKHDKKSDEGAKPSGAQSQPAQPAPAVNKS